MENYLIAVLRIIKYGNLKKTAKIIYNTQKIKINRANEIIPSLNPIHSTAIFNITLTINAIIEICAIRFQGNSMYIFTDKYLATR